MPPHHTLRRIVPGSRQSPGNQVPSALSCASGALHCACTTAAAWAPPIHAQPPPKAAGCFADCNGAVVPPLSESPPWDRSHSIPQAIASPCKSHGLHSCVCHAEKTNPRRRDCGAPLGSMPRLHCCSRPNPTQWGRPPRRRRPRSCCCGSERAQASALPAMTRRARVPAPMPCDPRPPTPHGAAAWTSPAGAAGGSGSALPFAGAAGASLAGAGAVLPVDCSCR